MPVLGLLAAAREVARHHLRIVKNCRGDYARLVLERSIVPRKNYTTRRSSSV
jgi:hypothetical protein